MKQIGNPWEQCAGKCTADSAWHMRGQCRLRMLCMLCLGQSCCESTRAAHLEAAIN